MAKIKYIRDFLLNKIYPRTIFRAVYDDNGNRLDNVFNQISREAADGGRYVDSTQVIINFEDEGATLKQEDTYLRGQINTLSQNLAGLITLISTANLVYVDGNTMKKTVPCDSGARGFILQLVGGGRANFRTLNLTYNRTSSTSIEILALNDKGEFQSGESISVEVYQLK